jgi:hypothetical protein
MKAAAVEYSEILSRSSCGSTEEKHKKYHNNRYTGRDSNQSSSEYKPEAILPEQASYIPVTIESID